MKRSSCDVRRIKRARCYTIPQLAAVLTISIGTARRWVRDGMPLIDREWPRLVQGGEFLSWFKARRNSRKVKCGSREMYCCKCRDARQIMPGSVVIIHRNEKSATVKARCIACGTVMNRHCSRQNAAEWADLAHPSQGRKLRLLASLRPLVNDTGETSPEAQAG